MLFSVNQHGGVAWSMTELSLGMAVTQNYIHKVDVMTRGNHVVVVPLVEDASPESMEQADKCRELPCSAKPEVDFSKIWPLQSVHAKPQREWSNATHGENINVGGR
jgi:hypothetical protein